MNLQPLACSAAADSVLQVYLLGSVEFEAALALQRQLVYHVAGDRACAGLILCEHPPLITVGRHGSSAHILCGPEELRARRWRVRWVNRGGGCLLHVPGQLAVYSILPLDRLGLGLEAYLKRLHDVLAAVLGDFDVRAATNAGHAGLWARERPIAGVGVAVRDWVSYHGAFLNVNPDLELFRAVRHGSATALPMTSLERERHGPLRPSLVRERLIEHFMTRFGFGRMSLFSDHPSLGRKARANAVAART